MELLIAMYLFAILVAIGFVSDRIANYLKRIENKLDSINQNTSKR
jgi:hypothetical protein